jgi:hypothetical protein
MCVIITWLYNVNAVEDCYPGVLNAGNIQTVELF